MKFIFRKKLRAKEEKLMAKERELMVREELIVRKELIAREKKIITDKLYKNLKSFFQKNEKIKFTRFKKPDISIILVLFNQAQFTLECLRLLKLQKNISFEIIVIDNASNDSTDELLYHCQNVVVIKNTENVGFLRAAQQGAQIANATNLLFLNNDIWYLNEDALALALNLLNSDHKIGAIGGRVMLPHGYLQEAGVSINQWGSRQCYRDRASDSFEVMFQRQVDYCSGLFLLTPKHIFDSLDGFDDQYAPAYFEDSDYCLRLNYAGLKVIYEPRILIGHIENGSEVKEGNARALYEKNRAYFTNKHKVWLQTLNQSHDSLGSALDELMSRHHKRDQPRLLFIGHGIPSQHTLNLMKLVCDSDFVVTYFSLEKFELSWDEIYDVFDIRIEVCKGLELSDLDKFMYDRRGYYELIIDEKWLNYFQYLKGYPRIDDEWLNYSQYLKSYTNDPPNRLKNDMDLIAHFLLIKNNSARLNVDVMKLEQSELIL